MRELTIIGDIHPDFLEDGTMQHVTHPVTKPLIDGAPDLGWDGDSRLAIYQHLESKRFIAYRLESDGEYRPFARLPEGTELTPASINSLIVRFMDHDTRRGYDPYKEIMDDLEKRERDTAAYNRAALEQWGDKLHFALAHSHMPGIDITRPRQVPLKKG